jgi:hypothetical protein
MPHAFQAECVVLCVYEQHILMTATDCSDNELISQL